MRIHSCPVNSVAMCLHELGTAFSDPMQQGCCIGAYMDVFTASR